MKGLLLTFLMIAVSAFSKEYTINYDSFANKLFFSRTVEERSALWQRPRFISALPKELTVYSEPNSGLTERVIYCAGNAKASTIATGLRNTSIRQIAMARKAGYTVCLMTATSLNDIIAALQKNPDYILCSGALDLQRVKTILLSDHSGKFTPVLSPIDWDALPADCVLNYDSAAPRSTGTALRVMSYNILAQTFDEQRLASMRVTDIARTIGDFAPDIAGLQELDLHWYANLDTGVLKSLKFIHAGITPYPPSIALLYNSQRFRVVENGFVPFTDKWIRAMIWAVLEDLGDGRRFIIANTHWDLTVPKRQKNSAMMTEAIQELRKKYNCPVICFGDFNSKITSQEFPAFLSGAGLRDAVESAPVVENRNIASACSYHYLFAPLAGDRHIDHVVYSDGLQPLAARLILKRELLEYSDHLPVVVDFKY